MKHMKIEIRVHTHKNSSILFIITYRKLDRELAPRVRPGDKLQLEDATTISLSSSFLIFPSGLAHDAYRHSHRVRKNACSWMQNGFKGRFAVGDRLDYEAIIRFYESCARLSTAS